MPHPLFTPVILLCPLILPLRHGTPGTAQFIEDIRDGVFIQHTMESMLFDPAGKQLMAEAVYLYGVMLTLMDCKIDGAVRERILVAYYRVKVRPPPHLATVLRRRGAIAAPDM